MIISRSPLRISFAGGGTDIPSIYKSCDGGICVSTSINRYVYVTVNKKFDGKVSVRYRIHENVDHVQQLKHPLIREILLNYKIYEGIEIVIISEVPARGSGLGASSALAVALCHYYFIDNKLKTSSKKKKKNYSKKSDWKDFIEKNPDRLMKP